MAVVLVMAVHYHEKLGGGWIGVQLFFVLSGFLITRILLAAKANTTSFGSYLKTFWVRRALRIFPLALLFILIGEVLWRVTDIPQTWPAARPWLLTYTLNFGHMFNLVPISDVYSHFWSLAVEEQFYLFWPLVIWYLSRKALQVAILTMIFAAPLARWLLVDTNTLTTTQLYFFTPTLFDAFAAGAALVVFDLQWIRQVRWWALGGCAIAFAAGFFANLPTGLHFSLWSMGYPYFMPSLMQYVWGYTLLNVAAALLILACLRDQLKLFANPHLVEIGKISYGIYIIHRPVYRMVVAIQPWLASYMTPLVLRLVSVAVFLAGSVLLAKLSYRYFELPFLRLKSRFEYREQVHRN